MLAVALKGVFLIGVISWYSVAIMSMINDYFRTEFKEYLKKNPIASTKADHVLPAIVITSQHIQQHIENGKLFESIDNENNEQQQPLEINEQFQWDSSTTERNVDNGKMHCVQVNNREEILMRLFGEKPSFICGVCAIDSSLND